MSKKKSQSKGAFIHSTFVKHFAGTKIAKVNTVTASPKDSSAPFRTYHEIHFTDDKILLIYQGVDNVDHDSTVRILDRGTYGMVAFVSVSPVLYRDGVAGRTITFSDINRAPIVSIECFTGEKGSIGNDIGFGVVNGKDFIRGEIVTPER